MFGNLLSGPHFELLGTILLKIYAFFWLTSSVVEKILAMLCIIT